MKPDYLDALLLMSRLELNNENYDESIRYLKKAINFAPNDIGLIFELGLVYYDIKEYDSAIIYFNSILNLVPDFSDARYYLGLSYAYEKEFNQAIKQFEILKDSNFENTSITRIINNIENNIEPLSGVE
jgi:tetratricopeptide (TPR) repeat protein